MRVGILSMGSNDYLFYGILARVPNIGEAVLFSKTQRYKVVSVMTEILQDKYYVIVEAF